MIRTREVCYEMKAGDKVGKRTILGHAFSPGVNKRWQTAWQFVVQCSCGEVSVCYATNLKKQSSDSVCLSCTNKAAASKIQKHGETGTKIYWIWKQMIGRCHNLTNEGYFRYGAKGITVCEEWHDLKVFIAWALANGYRDGLSLHRVKKHLSYSSNNCIWLTKGEHGAITREEDETSSGGIVLTKELNTSI